MENASFGEDGYSQDELKMEDDPLLNEEEEDATEEESPPMGETGEISGDSIDGDDPEKALADAWFDIVEVSDNGEEDDMNEESTWFDSENVQVKCEPEEEEGSDIEGDSNACFEFEYEGVEADQEEPPSAQCASCEERFMDKDDLAEHEMTHPELVTQCADCPEEVLKRFYQEHRAKHHKKRKKHKCPNCDKAFDMIRKLTLHLKTCIKESENIPSGEYKECPNCEESVPVSMIIKHLKAHALSEVETWEKNKDGDLQCHRCERTFDIRYKAMNHLLSHYLPDRSFECEMCCYPSSTQSLSEWHMKHVCLQERRDFHRTDAKDITDPGYEIPERKTRNRTGINPMKPERVLCDICNKELNKTSLANHKNIVHKERVEAYQCPQCPKVYYSKPTLTFHIHTVHKIKSPVFPCGTCRKLFSNPDDRSEHAKKYHNPKRIRCTECDSEMVYYSAKCHYLRHAWEALGIEGATSETQGTFHCPRCPRSFSFAQHFVNHVVNHYQPQRIFECEKCYLALSTQTLLAKHRLLCNGFAAESDMRKHPVRVPSRRKAAKHGLDQDSSEEEQVALRSQYGVVVNRWQCEKCEVLFNTESECQDHIQLEHENEKVEEEVMFLMFGDSK